MSFWMDLYPGTLPIHHTIRRLRGEGHVPAIVRDEHHVSPAVGVLFISLRLQNGPDGLEHCTYGQRVPRRGPRPANYAANSNVLNVLEMPAREEGDKYGSRLAAVVGS